MAEPDSEIEIRPITRAEAGAWRALRLEMLRNHPTAFKSSFEEEAARAMEHFADAIGEDGVDVRFGVYRAGQLMGAAGFLREKRAKTAHKGVMGSVYVKPELRGRGVGEALVRRVVDHARQHVVLLLCSVVSDNRAARALYGRLGFVRYGLEPRALRYAGRDYDEELLALALD
jgi:ribosomal protein S18 acetylase RimI-like enzyme